MSDPRMTCPQCGEAMNHHANKIDYSRLELEGTPSGSFEEVIEEVHTCPHCGRIELRPEGGNSRA